MTAVRALQPDVGIVHATRCDVEGNAQWDGTSGPDVEIARSARRVVVTCEEIVSRGEVVRTAHMTKVPGYYVHAVVEAPFGAHPTSHVPAYAQDAWQIMEYAEAAGGEGFSTYVERLRAETEEGYRERVLGDGRGDVLRALVGRAQTLEAHWVAVS
jgi:glutaconate CoA-transferase subunit A